MWWCTQRNVVQTLFLHVATTLTYLLQMARFERERFFFELVDCQVIQIVREIPSFCVQRRNIPLDFSVCWIEAKTICEMDCKCGSRNIAFACTGCARTAAHRRWLGRGNAAEGAVQQVGNVAEVEK